MMKWSLSACVRACGDSVYLNDALGADEDARSDDRAHDDRYSADEADLRLQRHDFDAVVHLSAGYRRGRHVGCRAAAVRRTVAFRRRRHRLPLNLPNVGSE